MMSKMILPKLHIRISKDGKVLADRSSHSWTKNHWLHMFCACSGYPNTSGDSLSLTDVDNTERATVSRQICITKESEFKGGAGDATQGIVIGTSTTAEAFTDYALGTKVAHGTAATQMEYSIMGEAGFAGTKEITWTRYFTNSSGSSITVGEIGLIKNLDASGSANYDFLVARDVLSPTVAVANTEILQVDYTITMVWGS